MIEETPGRRWLDQAPSHDTLDLDVNGRFGLDSEQLVDYSNDPRRNLTAVEAGSFDRTESVRSRPSIVGVAFARVGKLRSP